MTNQEARQLLMKQVTDARKCMESWPEWKKNILVQSGKPTVDTPRKPVNNQK